MFLILTGQESMRPFSFLQMIDHANLPTECRMRKSIETEIFFYLVMVCPPGKRDLDVNRHKMLGSLPDFRFSLYFSSNQNNSFIDRKSLK